MACLRCACAAPKTQDFTNLGMIMQTIGLHYGQAKLQDDEEMAERLGRLGRPRPCLSLAFHCL